LELKAICSLGPDVTSLVAVETAQFIGIAPLPGMELLNEHSISVKGKRFLIDVQLSPA